MSDKYRALCDAISLCSMLSLTKYLEKRSTSQLCTKHTQCAIADNEDVANVVDECKCPF